MALTLKTLQEPTVPGATRFWQVEATFGATYTKEGEAFKPSNVPGLTKFEGTPMVTLVHGDEAEEAELFISDAWYEGEKIHLLDAKTGKELAEGKKTAKVKVIVFGFGK